jgi:hypothetical protein
MRTRPSPGRCAWSLATSIRRRRRGRASSPASLRVGGGAEPLSPQRRLDWGLARRWEVLRQIARSGCPTRAIDPEVAFREVRQIALRAGETLIEAGVPSRFVYVPLGEGLRGLPLGGDPRLHHPRRRPRRGDRRHPRRGAKLQRRGGPRPGAPCRPKEVFLDHWHVTYDEPAFAALLAPQAG